MTKEQLIQQGDEVCREGMERFAEIQREPPANAHEAVDQTTELIDVSSEQLDALRDLEPPEELRARYDDYLSAREDVLDLLERGREAADQQDTRAYEAAQLEADKGAAERHKLAQSVGFKDCSKPQTASAPSVAG